MFSSKRDRELANNKSLDKNAKLVILLTFIVFSFVIYAYKLFSLQILNGDAYKKQSKNISSQVTIIPAQRGEIYDRKGTVPIVINSDSFAIELTPGEIPKGLYDTVASKLAVDGV